ncbi:aminotransferase class V-fold PLP-dependent enzyme [Alteraurantiacibacter aquimixticola]|uniref:Aminotransferase class V-fold PLP-dependent enzyme n=1 Tax=Alteraurantiacibacter aquimixticola TaxID=2489173 RepID=A0A4T3EXN9_9SPHN|nr:aminotransferase class V-fold PLP-dependent enzyme [Alteraurantiacibacter aquimixticola]TIX49418.1 aminotransferase class V-fold PLP-dependent enzyme [Alteraurantiacibacter aquimixticola]
MQSVPSQRHRFAIPDDVHYLNCAYMSPLSNVVTQAMVDGAACKQRPWTYKPDDFFSICEAFRDRAARLCDVAAHSIAIVPSVSYALAIAARNLPLAKGQQVVMLGDQFPSNVYPWRQLAAERGGRVVAVERDADAAWTNAVLDAIGPDTAVVAVPHVHWADGRVVDLEAVGAKCREYGAALVLDLTQSLGAMPLDFAKVDPDFAVAACYKWLMGPYGTGMLYVAPRHHDGEPVEQNWINRGGSEDFTRLVDYRDDYQPGARRFDQGEKSNPPLMFGASAGLDFLLEFGVEAIAHTLAEETGRIAEEAAKLGLTSAPIGQRAPHFLSLGFPEGVPDGLTDRLAEKNVFVSLRGSSLRVTPHVYNNDADREALLETLRGA